MEKKDHRLNELLLDLKLNPKEFAESIGLKRVDRIYFVLNGRNDISTDLARIINGKYPNVSIEWLLTGGGRMLNPPHSDVNYIAPYINEDLIAVPYVSVDAAASFVESLYEMEYDIDTYGIMPEEGETLSDGTYTVFQIKGNSMEPTIPDGTKILAKKICEGKWEESSGVIVIVYGKTLSVKRILKNSLFNSNILTIKADNPVHGQIDVERREIRAMWQAVRVVSQKII